MPIFQRWTNKRKNLLRRFENRWFGTSVFGDEEGPGFSYTTGFWLNLNFPEVITFSLKREIAHDTFWHIYRTLKSGDVFAIGKPIESIFESGEAALLPVPEGQFRDYLGWSRWFLRRRRFPMRATSLDGSERVLPLAGGLFSRPH
jgi:hypothetical protein